MRKLLLLFFFIWITGGAGFASEEFKEEKKFEFYMAPADEYLPQPAEPLQFQEFRMGWKEPHQGTNWSAVVGQSLLAQGLFLAFRFTEEKTRVELKGPFFRDWLDSIKALEWKWDDGGKFFTNYIAHTWQGAMYANIFAYNNAHSQRVRLGWNRDYWNAKHKQFLFSTVSSFLSELGPLSEASLGNVGINRPGAQRMVDYVVTPVVGTYGWSVAEDGIDVLAERLMDNHKYWGRLVRSLAFTKSFVNVFLAFKPPWYRPRDHHHHLYVRAYGGEADYVGVGVGSPTANNTESGKNDR
jgi:hypothetical protein